MDLQEKLQKIWKSRHQIAEAMFNQYLSNDKDIKEEIARRLSICEANTCGYWDATGTSEKLVMKGKPGCTGCGCNGELKTACMSCHCYLLDAQVQKIKELDNITGDLPIDEYKEIIAQKQAKGIDVGPGPLWEALMTEEQEKEIKNLRWKKQFEKKEPEQPTDNKTTE